MTSLEIYHQLSHQRYGYLSPAEQQVVRLGGAVIACQLAMSESNIMKVDKQLKTDHCDLDRFLAELDLAVANLDRKVYL